MKTLKNYKKLFLTFGGYHENDIPICWNCNKEVAVDIHHLIPKRHGWSQKQQAKPHRQSLCPMSQVPHIRTF